MDIVKRAGALCAWGAVATTTVVQSALVAFLAATLVFLVFPEVDIAAAAVFYGSGRFAGRTGSIELYRDLFKALYVLGLALALAGVWFGYARQKSLLGLPGVKWLVVAATLVVGPGLVANVLLKNELGRARPAQTELFGGDKAFTPALVRTNQCERNCSFVSGEAASIFALFFGLAMVGGAAARPLIAAGLCLGFLAGLIRMAQGAHFLSDVVFAGIFMALTAALMRFLIIDVQRLRLGTSDAGSRSTVR